MKKRGAEHGMSLIELLVVVAIIAILAAMGIGTYLSAARQQPLVSACQQVQGACATARAKAMAENRRVALVFIGRDTTLAEFDIDADAYAILPLAVGEGIPAEMKDSDMVMLDRRVRIPTHTFVDGDQFWSGRLGGKHGSFMIVFAPDGLNGLVDFSADTDPIAGTSQSIFLALADNCEDDGDFIAGRPAGRITIDRFTGEATVNMMERKD